MLLHFYCIIITYYYILLIITYYYENIIITSLLRYYCVVITSLFPGAKTGNDELIIMYYVCIIHVFIIRLLLPIITNITHFYHLPTGQPAGVLDGDFPAADHELIKSEFDSERDNKRVEAEFSILKDYGQNKRHYSVHHVWCLDDAGSRNYKKCF